MTDDVFSTGVADSGALVFSSNISGGVGSDLGPDDGLAKGDLVLNRGGGAPSNDCRGVAFGMEVSDDFALTIGGLSSSCTGGVGLEASPRGDDDSWPLREYGECPATELRLRVLVKKLGRVLSLERWEFVMWLTGLGASATKAGVLGPGTAAGAADCGFTSTTSAGGSGGNDLETETSDDLALTTSGLTSSMEVFLTSANGEGVRSGASFTANGFGSFFAGGAGAEAEGDSGFLRANTECPATELRLLVLVKNDGLGLAAESSDCPNGTAS